MTNIPLTLNKSTNKLNQILPKIKYNKPKRQLTMDIKILILLVLDCTWNTINQRHKSTWLYFVVLHCLMLCMWSERNVGCFEGCERSLLEIKSFFLHYTPCMECGSITFFLFFPSYFTWIIVILVHYFCTHSTSPMYSGWLLF